MSKYTYGVLGILVLSIVFLSIVLTRKDTLEVGENKPVDLSTDYNNGVHLGYVTSFSSENGRIYLSIDFLQSFATAKGKILAAIEDDFCSTEKIQSYLYTEYSGDVDKKQVQELLNLQTEQDSLVFFSVMPDREILDYAKYTGCFPNGVKYTRNKSTVVRKSVVTQNFVGTVQGKKVSYKTIIDALTARQKSETSTTTYVLTVVEGTITKLEEEL